METEEYGYLGKIEDISKRAERAFKRLLNKQRDLYIKRLKNAPDIPSVFLVQANSMRSICRREERKEIPDPTFEFERWINENILTDSEEQLEMWVNNGREWIENAALIAGVESLLELELSIEFNMRDERLLRWLSERSRRSAQLIQGVSDEGVLMTLWDVVYDGNYSIPKAVEALKESYAFSDSRAERIARTEIITASRAGQYFGDGQSGLVVGKKWMSAKQERTRPGHRAADGQVVAFDEPFLVANKSGQLEPLLFPGDTSLGASASNVIQCRCWYYRILDGEDM